MVNIIKELRNGNKRPDNQSIFKHSNKGAVKKHVEEIPCSDKVLHS